MILLIYTLLICIIELIKIGFIQHKTGNITVTLELVPQAIVLIEDVFSHYVCPPYVNLILRWIKFTALRFCPRCWPVKSWATAHKEHAGNKTCFLWSFHEGGSHNRIHLKTAETRRFSDTKRRKCHYLTWSRLGSRSSQSDNQTSPRVHRYLPFIWQ